LLARAGVLIAATASVDVASSLDIDDIPFTYVVDGGWLLHKLKWPNCCSFVDIAEQYVSSVGIIILG
jgi:hypothetical protein